MNRQPEPGAGALPAIRLAVAEDAEAIAAIYAPHVERSAVSFEVVAPDASEMRRRVLATRSYTPWLVYVQSGVVAGFAYASRHRDRAAYQWSIDSTVYIDGASRRRGVGRALHTSLFAIARLQGFHAVHAGITLPNPSSVGLHESMGFRLVGVYRAVGYKFGAWHDVGWWQLELRERTGPPSPLRPLPELEADLPGLLAAAIASGLGG